MFSTSGGIGGGGTGEQNAYYMTSEHGPPSGTNGQYCQDVVKEVSLSLKIFLCVT